MIELIADAATTIAHTDAEGIVPTSASCSVRSPAGLVVESPAVTLPTVVTTVQAGSTVAALVLASAAGVVVGDRYAVTSDGVVYVVEVARLDGTTAHLRAGLPIVPDAGSPFRALRFSASVSALGLPNLGAGWQIEWVYASASASRRATVEAAVVRWPWRAAFEAGDVAALLSEAYRTPRAAAFCAMVAERVDAKLRGVIDRTGRRPWLYLDPAAFREVAEIGARWVLAELGIAPVGSDPVAAAREFRFSFNDEAGRVIAGLTAYDSQSTGRTDQPTRSNVLAIKAVR